MSFYRISELSINIINFFFFILSFLESFAMLFMISASSSFCGRKTLLREPDLDRAPDVDFDCLEFFDILLWDRSCEFWFLSFFISCSLTYLPPLAQFCSSVFRGCTGIVSMILGELTFDTKFDFIGGV